jgi:hypothetical protein
MRGFLGVVTMAACVVLGAHGLLRAAGQAPAWAYNVPDPAPAGSAPAAPPAQDASTKKLAGSDGAFTLVTTRFSFHHFVAALRTADAGDCRQRPASRCPRLLALPLPERPRAAENAAVSALRQ